MSKNTDCTVIEIKTILYLLHNISSDQANWNEDLPREELMHLLHMGRFLMDDLICQLGSSGSQQPLQN